MSTRPVKSAASRARGCGKCQRNQSLLLKFVGFRRSGRGTGAGGTLYRTDPYIARLRDTFESRQDVEQSAHVRWLFLHPDDFAGIGVRSNRGGDFVLRQRIELVEEEDGSIGVLALAAFGAKFVGHLSAGNQDAVRVGHLGIGNQRQEAWPLKVLELRSGVGMAQHAFRGKYDQRLAPQTQS